MVRPENMEGRLPESDAHALATQEGEALSTEDWIQAARKVLIRDGIGALKVNRLAKECNVTRGGFYWRFRNRADLLERLLHIWLLGNGSIIQRTLDVQTSAAERFEALGRLWIHEGNFDAKFDSAVRGWGAVSKKVAQLVRRVDDERIAAITRIFEDLGYSGDEALVRGRIVYYHQIGYYALGVVETKRRREELLPLYVRALAGPAFPHADGAGQ